jgi:hypothetical protein
MPNAGMSNAGMPNAECRMPNAGLPTTDCRNAGMPMTYQFDIRGIPGMLGIASARRS